MTEVSEQVKALIAQCRYQEAAEYLRANPDGQPQLKDRQNEELLPEAEGGTATPN